MKLEKYADAIIHGIGSILFITCMLIASILIFIYLGLEELYHKIKKIEL